MKRIVALLGLSSVLVLSSLCADELKNSLTNYNVAYIDEQAPSGTAGGLRKILENPGMYNFDTKLLLLTIIDTQILKFTHGSNN